MQVPTPTPTPAPIIRPVIRQTLGVMASVSAGFVPTGNGQCVAFVQAHGFSGYNGNAGTWRRYINTDSPRAGDAIVLREGSVGHIALVESVASQSYNLVEQNFLGRYIVSRRTISKDYANIVGFIMPP